VPKHIVQYAAMLEIVEFVQRIYPANQRHAFEPAIGGDDLGNHTLARLDLAMQPANCDLLVPP